MPFSDNFTRANETLGASANWTPVVGGRDRLRVLNNQVVSEGALSSAQAYLAPDQGSANLYVKAVVPSLINRNFNEVLAVRLVDEQNYIGIGVAATGAVWCRMRVASVDTDWFTSNTTTPIAVLAEAEPTSPTESTMRFYRDTGAGMTLIHTQLGVTNFQSETSSGLRSIAAGGVDGVVLWDDFETGALGAGGIHAVLRRRR